MHGFLWQALTTVLLWEVADLLMGSCENSQVAKIRNLQNFAGCEISTILPYAPKINQKPTKINTQKIKNKCIKLKIRLKTNIN